MSTTESVATSTTDAIAATRPRTERVTWSADTAPWVTSSVRKTALCRETADGWVLQHVRTVTLSQRAPSGCEIDTEPVLEDLPGFVRAKLPEGTRDSTGEVSGRV